MKYLEEVELAEAIVSASDLSKSFNTIVKYNGGKWKSPNQAKYLMKLAKTYQTDGAMKWAKKYDPQGSWTAFPLITMLKGYGVKDPTKIRYAGALFLIDETGVKARAKIKVKHPKKADLGWQGDSSLEPIYSSAQETFVRKGDDKVIDVEAEKKQASALKARQIGKNAPIIQRITSVPGWEKKDILQSFKSQLEKGYKLSPKQMMVLDKMAPPTIDAKDKADIKKKWDDLVKHFKREWVPVFNEIWKSHGQSYDAGKGLDSMLSGSYSSKGWDFDNLFTKVLDKKNMYSTVSQSLGMDTASGYWLASFAKRVDKVMKHKKGKALPKTTAKAMSGLAMLHDRLMDISENDLRKLLKDEYGSGEPAEDLFATFD